MNPEEIKKIAEDIAKTTLAFQEKNDANLAKYDVLHKESMEKIEKYLADQMEIRSQLQVLENALRRPETTRGEGVSDDLTSEQRDAIKEHKKAFQGYLRNNNGERGGNAETKQRSGTLGEAEDKLFETKALSTTSDPNGGYLVTPAMSARMMTRIFETSPMRAYATVESIGTGSLEIIIDDDEASSGWVGEVAPRPETNTPAIGKKIIPVHELYANPKATQTALDDAGRDLESWLADKVSRKFARDEATSFFSGNGVNKPRGILTYTAGTSTYARDTVEQVTTGSAGVITPDSLIALQNALKEEYQNGAVFFMARATFGDILKKKDGQGQYLWGPGLNGQMREGALLLGKPVRFAADMPAIASAALSVAYGDFAEGYTIVDRQGIRTLRDPYSSKPYVQFYTTKRVGGDVTNFEAFKLLVLT